MSEILCLQVTASHYSGLLSPSFIFSCTTIPSIFAYVKCIVSYCCSRENETLRQYRWIIRIHTDTLSAGCRLLKIKFHQLKEHNKEAHDMGYSHARIATLLISCSLSVYILFSLILSLNHINDSERFVWLRPCLHGVGDPGLVG